MRAGKPRRIGAGKCLFALAIAAVAAAFVHFDLASYLTLESLKANRAHLEGLRAAHAALFAAAFVAAYTVQTALSLPGAAVLSLAAGALFGVVPGTVYVAAGATAGAVAAFLACRYLFREWAVARLDGRLEAVDRGLRENGLSYLLFLRLVPAFPFFLVNLACGVTGLSLRTYAVGTLIGIRPGSLVFVNAGATLAAVDSASRVASPRALGSLALLGLFALVPVAAKAWRRRSAGRH